MINQKKVTHFHHYSAEYDECGGPISLKDGYIFLVTTNLFTLALYLFVYISFIFICLH